MRLQNVTNHVTLHLKVIRLRISNMDHLRIAMTAKIAILVLGFHSAYDRRSIIKEILF